MNNTLVALHLARKGIKDSEGREIAMMLSTNASLRKLELEGNFLGPNTAKEFGDVLKDKNHTLQYLDLDDNYLTNSGQDNQGVFKFAKSLFKNTTLISLSVSNNAMGPLCGEKFEESTEANTTLINFEFGINPFTLE
jgi:Ran GTPase-activating protein (RanGAP) involved in mRNA processing and transport